MPATDFASKTAAEWGTKALSGSSHELLPIASSTPAARLSLGLREVQDAIGSAATPLTVCYFGHGLENSWAIFSDNGGSPPLTFSTASWKTATPHYSMEQWSFRFRALAEKAWDERSLPTGVYLSGLKIPISWRPQIEQTATAVGLCLADVVRSVLRLGRSVTRQALVNVFADHISYWRELSREGDGGNNAGIACNYLTSTLEGMVVIPSGESSMAEKVDPRVIGEIVLDELKKTARGDRTYADLGGVVLNEDDYRKKLDEDLDFARSEVKKVIRIPTIKPQRWKSPAEQRMLAKMIVGFANAHKDIPPDDLLQSFLSNHQYVGNSFTGNDLQKVARTLQMEYNMNVLIPAKITDCLRSVAGPVKERNSESAACDGNPYPMVNMTPARVMTSHHPTRNEIRHHRLCASRLAHCHSELC